MTIEQRNNLHYLHITARNAWGAAEAGDERWDAAFAADKAFADALYAIWVTA